MCIRDRSYFDHAAIPDPTDPSTLFCIDGPRTRIATTLDPDVSLADLGSVSPCGNASTEWTFQSGLAGTLVINQNVSFRDHLVSFAPFALAMVDVTFPFDDRPENFWGVLLNADGSISLQNQVTGQFLDADPDGTADLSEQLLNDDGWFVV